MEFWAYLGALIMGFTLGVFGGGGSILTVPILVYLAQVEAVTATSYSLFVVGTTAALGSIRNHKKGNIAWTKGLVFALPSLVGVIASRTYLLPAIPQQFNLGGWFLDKDALILILFAGLMVLAAFSMIRKPKPTQATGKDKSLLLVGLDGLVVGGLTGLVGAGGGFLIVPALVLLLGMEMKKAVATSLVIIALKSSAGFVSDLWQGMPVEWTFLLVFSGLSMAGMLLGLKAAERVPSAKLKRGFGFFVLVMGLIIIWKETF